MKARDRVAAKFGGILTKEQISSLEAHRRQIYGDGGDVARELPRLRAITEREALQRLLPGYVRQFIVHAADVLDLQITGDLDAFFALGPGRSGSIDALWEILDHYPPEARMRLTVYRPAVGEPAIFLHPGEPVFESLRDIVRDHCGEAAMRGAAFEDPTATEASVVFAVETAVLQRKSEVRRLRRYNTGEPTAARAGDADRQSGFVAPGTPLTASSCRSLPGATRQPRDARAGTAGPRV